MTLFFGQALQNRNSGMNAILASDMLIVGIAAVDGVFGQGMVVDSALPM